MSSPSTTRVHADHTAVSAPYRRFDRYTMGSLYVAPPLAPLTSAMLLTNATGYSALTVAHLSVLTVAALLCAFVLRAAIHRALDHKPWPRLLVVAFVTACLSAAVLGALSAPPTGGVGLDIPTGTVLISLVTCVFGFSPAVGWRWIPLLALLVAAATTAVWLLLHAGQAASGRWFPALFTSSLVTAGLVASGVATTWMLRQMREQAELTVVRAELAVAEERLRFSRDLHDIFGRTLTAVAVKADLAAELATAGQVERATEEMREVQGVADEALREVRAVVAGYRAVNLDAELRGSRALLTAAGIQARLVGGAEGLGPRAAEALAWVVREGVTNVVHHSDARACTVALTTAAGWAQVRITNDGARPAAPRAGASGLAGLRGRLGDLGGSLETSRDGDTFTLTARVPEESA